MTERTQFLINTLKLESHPEGGFFKETYRSKGVISKPSLPDNFSGNRNYSTGIYFLLTSDTFSAFHKINQDEMWHYYEGSPITIHMIDTEGVYHAQKLGLNIEEGEQPQYTVPAGVWFAANVNETNSYTLVGCTVSPGFDFADFELADPGKLVLSFPKHEQLIRRFTR